MIQGVQPQSPSRDPMVDYADRPWYERANVHADRVYTVEDLKPGLNKLWKKATGNKGERKIHEDSEKSPEKAKDNADVEVEHNEFIAEDVSAEAKASHLQQGQQAMSAAIEKVA